MSRASGYKELEEFEDKQRKAKQIRVNAEMMKTMASDMDAVKRDLSIIETRVTFGQRTLESIEKELKDKSTLLGIHNAYLKLDVELRLLQGQLAALCTLVKMCMPNHVVPETPPPETPPLFSTPFVQHSPSPTYPQDHEI